MYREDIFHSMGTRLTAAEEGTADEDHQLMITTSDQLIRDVDEVLTMIEEQFPGLTDVVDPNDVYARLENLKHRTHRAIFVFVHLTQGAALVSSSNDDDGSTQPGGGRLHPHVTLVQAAIPHSTVEQVKWHFDRFASDDESVRLDRTMDAVLAELGGRLFVRDDREATWTVLREVLPDADPIFLLGLMEKHVGDQGGLFTSVDELQRNRKVYPTVMTMQAREEQSRKRKYQERNFSVDEIFEMFGDPVSHFDDVSRPVSTNYRNHVMFYLSRQFPHVKTDELTEILADRNHHLSPAYDWLLEKHQPPPSNANKKVKTSKASAAAKRNAAAISGDATVVIAEPANFDEDFCVELAYLEQRLDIIERGELERAERLSKMEAARASGALQSCSCCYDDEVLEEDALLCKTGHVMCRECVRRSAEVNIGEGKLAFPCLGPDCDEEIPLFYLQLILKRSVYLNLLRRIQDDEVRKANVDDLVSCPYCPYSCIMPNPDDKVFRCQNPQCMKDTCRFCQEPNHIPFRCDEIERRPETDMRVYVENRMTDALVRTCPNCKRRFIKSDGCNFMTCSCGKNMCYICGEAIRNHDHFGRPPNSCPCYSDDKVVDLQRVKAGGERAKEDFVQDHPEMKDVPMKHDPTAKLHAAYKSIMEKTWNVFPQEFIAQRVMATRRYIAPPPQGQWRNVHVTRRYSRTISVDGSPVTVSVVERRVLTRFFPS